MGRNRASRRRQGNDRRKEIEMTNILATVMVCFVTTTNEVPRYEPVEISDGSYSWLMYYDNSERPKYEFKTPIHINTPSEENQRVRIIREVKTTTLTFDWNGKKREVIDKEVLKEKRTLLTKKTTWEESQQQPTESGENELRNGD